MSANKKKNLKSAEADSSSEDEDIKNDDDNEEEEDDDMESDDSDGMDSESFQEKEELQIEFEGRAPVDPDAEGISQLLQRLVPRAQINCNQLAELLIAQNFVGSVICQCMDDGPDSETDDNMVEDDTIFGITSVVNLTAKKDKPVIEQLRKYITERAAKHATKQVQEQLRNLLDNEQQHVGLLINERFINIPAQISVPLLQNLHKEIEAAKAKKMKFNFGTLLMLVKFHRKLGKKGKPDEDQFTNAEEELLAERSKFSFEYAMDIESDWPEDVGGLKPYRKLLALEAKQLPQLINEIQAYINGE
ncbi:PREDICTED: protein BCCIP homolog [Drosophila arizonae]|uniref:Protein BCCIP homolog n=1 Tax=Drosophila arizonae TaxID=7263 RepID=A0ABM1Q1J3_DROAR|nr:PREDICTED: protein BCCIP homolog [Drosophila arizonae]